MPAAVWWRLALACLHPQWVLIRPCRVVLPVRLAPGEREAWLRLTDALTWALEVRVLDPARRDFARRVDLVETGPALAPLAPAAADPDLVVAAFSGGRDSLAQLGLLEELGRRTLLVTTTSPLSDLHDHTAAGRHRALTEVVARRDVELVEVGSDLRGALDNGYAGERYGVAVTELTDCLLYFATAFAVAHARGAGRVALASEAEVQGSARIDGRIVQHQHLMYSAVTQRALQALLAPTGIRYGGLTVPLRQFQIQRVLAHRYPDLRDLQFSCWEMGLDERACSACKECAHVAFNLMAEGVDPAAAGMDAGTLIRNADAWWPGRTTFPTRRTVPSLAFAGTLTGQLQRCLRRLTPEAMAAFAGPADVATYATLRDGLTGGEDPEPGYAGALLELLDPPLREGVRAIVDEHFTPQTDGEDQAALQRTLALSDWIAAPLTDPALDRRRPSRAGPVAPVQARPRVPPPPAEAELAPLRHLIPGPEPVLRGDRPLRVADTDLTGNERRYVEQALDDNYISSTGPFVGRFERAFAEAAGTEHAVACSSGGAALQLAYAAAGIDAGDEVIMPAFTMVATANAASHLGAIPVFADTDASTWNLDPDAAAAAITSRTRAIVVVHTYGQPADPGPLRAIAARNGLALIEDAAEAHGARAHGAPVGSHGVAAAFSFYGNKILTTGEGGVVTTSDPAVAALARELRDHGFSPERHFWHRLRAHNFRMTSLQAAVGLGQVERLAELVGRRQATAARYTEALRGIEGLTLPPAHAGLESVHWMFGVLVGDAFGCDRDTLRERLAAEGIETRTFFVPLHLQPAYLRERRGRRLPVAERLGRTGLYLPSGPSVTEADVARVAEAIARAGRPSSAYTAPRSAAATAGENRAS